MALSGSDVLLALQRASAQKTEISRNKKTKKKKAVSSSSVGAQREEEEDGGLQ
ncbi:hypothetical protein CJ030_MR3G019184 [Morella rubra]|uniref:Uncharacterized protein n=1 Tax=Morella rubra TaxID=262757 RepID=A0A6A1W3E5_9ROSI|nr:hypothetical protein CJ030_MR3G019184 [Morella rubra]